MAEIHVQAKKGSSSAWLWILISIIVIAALAFVFVWNNKNNIQKDTSSKTGQTSFVQYHALRVA
jgi:flagellar basal body-associated protein FliL